MLKTDLAEFLRRRREELSPEDVGLVPGPRRRAAGLRREEVAQLTGMSVDYYTRMEQARGPQPSIQMLSALSRALRLTADERDYVFRLAGHSAPARRDASPHVAPGLLRVLDRLDDTPALVLSDIGEALVANRLAVALFGDPAALSGHERSDVYRWFRVDGARDLYPEHDRDRQAGALVANLRVAFGIQGPNSRAGALVRTLLEESPEFAVLWDRQEVARRFEDHKVLVHPVIGPIELDCQVLFTEDQTQALLVLTAADRQAAEQVRLLGIVGSERFSVHN